MAWKFLDPTGCTYYNGVAFQYNLPGRGEKSARTEHPAPAPPDGLACGPSGIHIMHNLDAQNAPRNWWPWYVCAHGTVIGEDANKKRVAWIELRRVSPTTFARLLRPPFNAGAGRVLHNANLSEANLSEANLSEANLSEANLSGARWDEHTRWPEGFNPEASSQGAA